EGPPFFDVHVADVRRVDGLNPALTQRIVHGARHQFVRHVVKNLIFEALLDDTRRRLSGTKAGNPRAARIAFGNPVDLGVDDVAGDLDAHVLARVVDVYEFSLHQLVRW